MADQVINGDNDIIKNMEEDSWQQGSCPPDWEYVSAHTIEYTEEYI